MPKYLVDSHAIRALLEEQFIGDAVTKKAEEVTQHAEELAPNVTGRNKGSYKTRPAEVEPGADGKPLQRAVAYSDDPFDHLVEFGSANNPAYRPLTRAAQELGLEYDDTRE